MKNKNIEYAKQNARIYSSAYKPSYNMWRFMKSILGVVIHGSSTAHFDQSRKRIIK